MCETVKGRIYRSERPGVVRNILLLQYIAISNTAVLLEILENITIFCNNGRTLQSYCKIGVKLQFFNKLRSWTSVLHQ